MDLFKDAKPLSERDLARTPLLKDGDFWDTIQSIFELKEDEKERAPRKRHFSGVVEWTRYWFTYAYAAVACGQLTMETATAHCNNVCQLAILHTSTIALRYDQLVRARLAQLVENGSHTSDKLSEVDTPSVSELLNEQLANYNRKQLGSESSDSMTGSKKRRRDWFGKGKPDANPPNEEARETEKVRRVAPLLLRDHPWSLFLTPDPSRVWIWMPNSRTLTTFQRPLGQ